MYQEVIHIPDAGLQKPNMRVIFFDSVQEFVSMDKGGTCAETYRYGVTHRAMETSNKNWFGADTIDEINRILEEGHPRYVEMVEAQNVSFHAPEVARRRRVRGDYGDELDIHAVNSGNLPRAWQRLAQRGSKLGTRSVRLVVQTNMIANVTADMLQWIGVTALAVAKGMTEAGYNLAIDVVMCSDDVSTEESIFLRTPVKAYENTLDIQSLTSVTCFPGFWRARGLGLNYGLAKGSRKAPHTITSDKVQKYIIPRYYNNPGETVVYIPNTIWSKEKSADAIRRIMDDFSNQPAARAA